MGEIIKKSVGAGMMVGIGCLFYIVIPNHIIGAVMFSLGLLTILYCNLYLYTGMVGSVTASKTRIGVLLITFLGNIVGILSMWWLAGCAFPDMLESIAEVGMSKAQEPLIQSFFQAVLCGALIQTAVTLFKQGSPIGMMMCVAGFVLCGLEHSIANCFWLAGCNNCILLILIDAVGNAVGAKMMNDFDVKRQSGSR